MKEQMKYRLGTALWLVLLLVTMTACHQTPETGKIVVASQEEQDMYRSHVYGTTEEEQEQKAVDYAKEVYATAALAKEYGLLDSFSFDAIMAEREQVNQTNQEKIENGEVVMGLITYDPYQYFDYYMSCLQSDLQEAITASPSKELLEEAEAFWEENQERFIQEVTVTFRYRPAESEQWEEAQTLTRDQLQTLVRANREDLAELLYTGTLGAELPYEDGIICIDNRNISYITPDENSEFVMEIFLSNVKLNQMIQESADSLELCFSE